MAKEKNFRVQIPLWTIVTPRTVIPALAVVGSDSSMDDCNEGFCIEAVLCDVFRFLYGRL